MRKYTDNIGQEVKVEDVVWGKTGGRYQATVLGVVRSFTKGGSPRIDVIDSSREFRFRQRDKPIPLVSDYVKIDPFNLPEETRKKVAQALTEVPV